MTTTEAPPPVDPVRFGLPGDDEIILHHPWKLSRGDCLLDTLRGRPPRDVADVGVNDMYYTRLLKSIAGGETFAADIFFPAEGTVKDGITCVNDIEKLPANRLDTIVMMDVLEHVPDDRRFFNTAVDKLKDGGTILVTVPAYQFLFSTFDTRAGHFRRYNRQHLLALLRQNDSLEIEKCHYFYTTLFLALLFSMPWKKKKDRTERQWKYPEKSKVTTLARQLLNIDFRLNRALAKARIHLPGLSLVATCRKKTRGHR
jgi:SAM-dependent methyltransferase